MLVDFKSSKNVSFLTPANLLVVKSAMIKDRVFGSTSATCSGIGSIFSLESMEHTSRLCSFHNPAGTFACLLSRLALLGLLAGFVLVKSNWLGVMFNL